MKKILLHTCCAPCVTACLDVLQGQMPWENILETMPQFDECIVYFYNPNIHPEVEYHLRADEAKRYADLAEATFIEGKYQPQIWIQKTKGLKDEPERGARCRICYDMRLAEAFRVAQEQKCHAVASTLTLSPYKDTVAVNTIGRRLQEETGIPYLVTDFKKNGGFLRSKEITRKECIYCQNYCGCPSSLRDKFQREQARKNR